MEEISFAIIVLGVIALLCSVAFYEHKEKLAHIQQGQCEKHLPNGWTTEWEKC